MGGLIGSLMVAAPLAQAQSRTQSDTPVRCGSNDSRYARCAVRWRQVELYKQESKSACVRGQSWGMDKGAVWVDRGCRGLFGPAGRGNAYKNNSRPGHGQSNGRPGPSWDRQISLQCDSNSKKYQMCQVDVGRNGKVRLGRQLSKARCTQGHSWGWNRAGVWVSHGCRGQFLVDRRR